MRDLAITFIVFGSLPFILARPWIGILMWSWLGYMNPHRLAFGFAYSFPFSEVVAAATFIGLVFARDRRWLPISAVTVTWLLFIAWMTTTTFFAIDPVEGWAGWDKAMKIQLFALLTVMLIRTRERLVALVWVIGLSLGFYGLKGGLFVLRGGGEWRVWGPPGTFITDNNALALAVIMVLPLLWFLFGATSRRWLRWLIGAAMILSCASVLGSHSRGAALAGGLMVCFLWLKGSRKGLIGMAIALVLPVLVLSMPQKWFDRMGTVSSFEQDTSALGRLHAWQFAIEMAVQRPIGGGFGSFTEENYRRFAPDVVREIEGLGDTRFQEAHSIYFKVLGDHGFPGLILFLALAVATYRSAGSVIRQARDSPQLQWAGNLAAMAQVSMVGFAIGGAFLGLSYFDLYYHLVAIIVVLRSVVDETVIEPVPAVVEAAPAATDAQVAGS
ncbi:hypothetical protein GPROT2_00567 [Gammaproteobacteria bacterium]|nr:hypothetical protein GPROT2_00567 [Gammaproteobacteria bacterium]